MHQRTYRRRLPVWYHKAGQCLHVHLMGKHKLCASHKMEHGTGANEAVLCFHTDASKCGGEKQIKTSYLILHDFICVKFRNWQAKPLCRKAQRLKIKGKYKLML